MISAKKVMNIKVEELIKTYNFYFGHSSFHKVVANIDDKLTYLSQVFTHIHKYIVSHTYTKVVSHTYINV
jgi:hypothetical protein